MSRIKVIKGTWISDVIKRSWKQRLLTRPWMPFIQFTLNNHAYFTEGGDVCYVSPEIFKRLLGKQYDGNIKHVHITELERVCGV